MCDGELQEAQRGLKGTVKAQHGLKGTQLKLSVDLDQWNSEQQISNVPAVLEWLVDCKKLLGVLL